LIQLLKALSTLATTVAEFGDSRHFRQQSPNSATLTEFGDCCLLLAFALHFLLMILNLMLL